MGIILSLAFVLWGVENYLNGSSKKNLVAKVNGNEITDSQLNSDYQRLLMRLRAQVGDSFSLPPTISAQLKMNVLNNLILQSVLVQAAHKAGFRITPYQISAVIKQMPEFQEKGQFSKTHFQEIISRLNYTQPEFIADIQGTMLLNQVTSGILETNFVLPNELNQIITLLEQKRDIQYALLPISEFQKKILIPESQITNYYLQNQDKFRSPAKLQIEYILLSIDELKKNIKITEQELNGFLNSNRDLKKTDPKVLEKAKAVLLQQRAEQEFLSVSDKLSDLAYTNSNSLKEAQAATGLKVQVSDYFSQTGGTTWISKNPKVIATAFSPELIKNRNNSSLIETKPGNAVILRIKDYRPESIQPISTVRKQIREALMVSEASSKTMEKGKALLAKVKEQGNFSKVIASQGLTIINKQKITRSQRDINSQILQLAFSIGPASKQKIAGFQLLNGDYAIVMVSKIENLPLDKIFSQKIDNIRRKYPEIYGKMEYELYIINQMNRAKVKSFYQ